MPIKESKHFLVALVFIFLILFVLLLLGFLAPLVLGLLLAGGSYGIYNAFLHAVKIKSIAALIAVFIVSLLIILPALGVLTLIAKEAFTLFNAREEILFNEDFVQTLNNYFVPFNINFQDFFAKHIIPIVQNLGTIITEEIGGLFSNAVSLAINFFIMLITLFYLLRDGKTFGRFLINLSPLKERDELLLYQTFRETGQAIFYSSIVAALVQGFLAGIAFFFAGLSAPILWGTIMAFLAFIPLFGPYIVFIPAGIYLLAIDKPTVALIFLAYNILIVSTVDNIIKPKLISGRVQLHPFFVFLTILGGLKVFGLMGIIYGPLIYAIFIALLKVYREMSDPERNPAL